jgi:hypothetical protein
MNPTFEWLFSFHCLALLYALPIIELNVKVSDTTDDDIALKPGHKKILSKELVVEDIGFEPMTLSLQS